MKIGLLILLSILLLSSISAVEFQGKTDFQQGETFFAKISGNFFEPISESGIIFLKGHTRISMIPIVEKIDGDYYISAQLFGKSPGNYSLVVGNVKISQFGQIIAQNLERNFTINENRSDFSIEPGFVSTNKSFEVKIQNLKDSEITLDYKIFNESEISGELGGSGFFDFSSFFGSSGTSENGGTGIKIKTGETKKIIFPAKDFSSFAIQKILFTSENTNYELPVFISANRTEIISESGRIKFDPSEIKISLGLNSRTNKTIYLFNLGFEDLENLELSFSDSLKPYLSVSKKNISSLGKNSSEGIEISFFSGDKEEKIEGQIKAKTQDDFYDYVSVSLNFIKNYLQSNASDSSTPFCSELNGTLCDSSREICESGNSKVSRDGICCLSACVPISGSSYGKIIGWTILVIAICFVAWFYFFKYRKTKNVIDLLKVARGR